MKVYLVVILLGIYIFAVAALGMVRLGSLTPLYIGGAISAITIWIGWLMGKGLRSVRNVALGWLVLTTIALTYFTTNYIQGHTDSDNTVMLMFGSKAVFAFITLMIVWKFSPRRRVRSF